MPSLVPPSTIVQYAKMPKRIDGRPVMTSAVDRRRRENCDFDSAMRSPADESDGDRGQRRDADDDDGADDGIREASDRIGVAERRDRRLKR